ncbi:hypothetical protein [Thermoflexus sp.]|uniref:hypothetical protein n=1 Tax=Thermoflexus sp. TaxID=1969742 RepID=UPI0035E452FA
MTRYHGQHQQDRLDRQAVAGIAGHRDRVGSGERKQPPEADQQGSAMAAVGEHRADERHRQQEDLDAVAQEVKISWLHNVLVGDLIRG